MFRTMMLGAGALLAVAVGGGAAIAGPVAQTVFTAAGLGSSATWTYLASGVTFTGSGSGVLNLRLSDYPDYFGYAKPNNHNNRTQVFGPGSAIGATATIDPAYDPFLLYFSTTGFFGVDANAQFSDNTYDLSKQGDIAIYQKGATYALFYDDGGPVFSDDNDYNDLVVTYTAVPEPVSLSLLGAGLVGLGLVRRRRDRA